MLCKKCGWVIPEGVSYCTGCGTKVEVENQADAAVSKQGQKEDSGEKRSRHGAKIVIAAIGGIIIAVGLSLYFHSDSYLSRRRDSIIRSVDSQLASGDYLGAVQTLTEGARDLEDEVLAEWESNVRRHIVISTKVSYEDGNMTQREEYEYDAIGNLTKCTIYAPGGNVIGWTEYAFDAAGNELKSVTYNKNGNIAERREYAYDIVGNETEYVRYEYGEEKMRRESEYEYDASGNLISYGTTGSARTWEVYEYDTDGKTLKMTRYLADGRLSSWIEYEYGADGNEIRETDYDQRGEVSRWEEYEYDKYGSVVKRTSWYREAYTDMPGSETYVQEFDYKYDSSGNVLKTASRYTDGTNTWRDEIVEYEYDRSGNLAKATYHNYDGNVHTYEYDAAGNEVNYVHDYQDGSVYREEHEYDAMNNLLREAFYYEKFDRWDVYTYEYTYIFVGEM